MADTYRIYGFNKKKGWQKIDIVHDKKRATQIGDNLSSDKYFSYLIIKHYENANYDFPFISRNLYNKNRDEEER